MAWIPLPAAPDTFHGGYGINFGDVTATILDLHDEDVHVIKRGLGRVEVERQGTMSNCCALSRGPRRQQLTGILHKDTVSRGEKQESLHSHQGTHSVCISILFNAICFPHDY